MVGAAVVVVVGAAVVVVVAPSSWSGAADLGPGAQVPGGRQRELITCRDRVGVDAADAAGLAAARVARAELVAAVDLRDLGVRPRAPSRPAPRAARRAEEAAPGLGGGERAGQGVEASVVHARSFRYLGGRSPGRGFAGESTPTLARAAGAVNPYRGTAGGQAAAGAPHSYAGELVLRLTEAEVEDLARPGLEQVAD